LPYSDPVVAPVHGVDSSAGIVESVSVACAEAAESPAARIVGLSSGIDVTVQGVKAAGLLVLSDEGVGCCV
jgi:hypothetical protein